MFENKPYAPPQSKATPFDDIIFEGKLARMRDPGRLLAICVKCEACENLKQNEKTLVYVNPLAFLGLIFGPIGLMIAYLIVRKKMSIEYSTCTPCSIKMSRWERREKLAWLAFFGLMVLGLFGPSYVNGFCLLMVLPTIIFALFCATRKDTGLSIKRFDYGYFYVAGVPRPNK